VCVKRACHIFSVFIMPKIIKIGEFLTRLFKKIKRWTFLEHSVVTISSHYTNESKLPGVSRSDVLGRYPSDHVAEPRVSVNLIAFQSLRACRILYRAALNAVWFHSITGHHLSMLVHITWSDLNVSTQLSWSRSCAKSSVVVIGRGHCSETGRLVLNSVYL